MGIHWKEMNFMECLKKQHKNQALILELEMHIICSISRNVISVMM